MKSLKTVTHLKRAVKTLRMVYSKVDIEKKLYDLGICSSERFSLPDFLGIGAPQSGTTWLYENLRCHPESYLPEPKELHYFDRGFYRSLRSYSNRFKAAGHKVKGEITPGYSCLNVERIRFIDTIMPNVRLIFLMRNPIDRAWAAARRVFSRVVGRGLQEVDESEFYACFRGDLARPGDYAPGLNRGDYVAILDNWLSVFPRKQLYVGFFEDIVNRPLELLGEVFAHVGLSQAVQWNSFPYDQVINKNPDAAMPKKYRSFLEEMYCRDIETLYERFGAPIAPWRCSRDAD